MDSGFYDVVTFAFLALSAWPYLYIKIKGGSHQFLFVASVFGILVLTAILLYVVALPVNLFAVKLLPQFEAFGVSTVHLMNVPIEFVANWFSIVVYPVLFLVLPNFVHKRYSIFRLTSSSSLPATRAGNSGDESPSSP